MAVTEKLRDIAEQIEIVRDPGEDGEDRDIYDMPLNPDIDFTLDNIDEALFWKDYARGFTIIDGLPGSGKTLLLITAALRLNYFFLRPVVMDFWPKQAFIDLVGKENFTFLSAASLKEDIKRCDKLAKDSNWNLSPEEKIDWITTNGSVKLRGCTLALSEIDRWLNCRRTGGDENKVITDLIKRYRHHDILILGDCVSRWDLDRQRALPRMTARVTCQRLPDKHFKYTFRRTSLLEMEGVVYRGGVETLTLYGPHFYKYYHTKNPVASTTKFKYSDKKNGGKEDGATDNEGREADVSGESQGYYGPNSHLDPSRN